MENGKKQIKNNYIKIAILITVILVSMGITSLIYSKYKIVQVNYVPLDFMVGDSIGFNLDNDALHFGILPKSSAASRSFNLTNNYEYPVKINIKFDSSNVDWISIGKNGFILQPNEIKGVPISLTIPSNAEEKQYNATLKIVMLRA